MTTVEHVAVHTCTLCGRAGSKQFTTGADGARCSNRFRCADRVALAANEPPPLRVTEPTVPVHLFGRLACTAEVGPMAPTAAGVTCHDCLRRYAAYLFLGGQPL